jgi:hypothetical protein
MSDRKLELASSGSVATDQTQDGLKISSIESVTLSDGEVRRTRTVPPNALAAVCADRGDCAAQIGVFW